MRALPVVVASAIAFSLFAACPPGRCPRRVTTPSLAVGGPDGGVFVAGQALTVNLEVPADTCTNEPAEQIRATVNGPDSQGIPVTLIAGGNLGEGVVQNDGGQRVGLSFVADKPGWYRADVIYEFGYGSSIVDVLVAREREADLVLNGAEPPCHTVADLPSGAILCGGAVYRNGVLVQELQSAGSAVVADTSADVAWVFDGAVVRKLRDTASGPLVEETSIAAPIGGLVRVPFASENDLVLADENDMVLFRDVGGTLQIAGTFAFVQAPVQVIRDGQRLFVAYHEVADAGVGVPGLSSANVCRYDITSAGFVEGDCESLSGAPVASTQGLLWLEEETSSTSPMTGMRTRIATLEMALLKGEAFVLAEQLRVPDGWAAHGSRLAGAPVITSEKPVPGAPRVPTLLDGGQLELQVFDTVLSAPARANARFVWGEGPDQKIQVLRR